MGGEEGGCSERDLHAHRQVCLGLGENECQAHEVVQKDPQADEEVIQCGSSSVPAHCSAGRVGVAGCRLETTGWAINPIPSVTLQTMTYVKS